ncbi:MAG TPA: hypothetical protein VN798_15525 [Pseudomonas sp.]|nr:hypothetical protein [Pseudomonas sp.]
MRTPKLVNPLFAAMLMFGCAASIAADQSGGSSLPPGINPASPAGGNGGDAQGYDKKPVNPAPPGSEKAKDAQPPAKHPMKHKSTHLPPTPKKADPNKQ